MALDLPAPAIALRWATQKSPFEKLVTLLQLVGVLFAVTCNRPGRCL